MKTNVGQWGRIGMSCILAVFASKHVFFCLVGAVVLAAGCNRQREKLPAEEAVSPGDPKAVKVTVQPVTFRPVQRTVGVVGTLHGYEEISLGAKVAGRVRKIAHDVSDRVRPGELLLEIEPTDFQLNVRQAQKALQVELAKLGLTELPSLRTDVTRVPTVVQAQLRRDNAERRLERAKALRASKAGTEEDLTEKMSEFRVAQAEYDNQVLVAKAGIAAIQVKQEALAIAQQQLQDTLIRVPAPSQPVPGVDKGATYAITSRPVAEGSYVMVGAELFKLVIDQPLKFRAPVPERKSGAVRLGQKADIYTAAFQHPFPGEVTRINPAIDPQTRTFEVEILVPNTQAELKPGGFAKTAIVTDLDEHAATVPLESLVNFAGVSKIFLVVDGHAKEVPVTLGVQDTEWVEIASPTLPENSQVVTSGQTVIADGTAVAVRMPPLRNSTVLTAESEVKSREVPVTPMARKGATP
ncbi:MAG: efflux RND transporter periplasmic adaptor subunit [Planctomycetia bacterium]|nr:efflux RND transporter periplasmic adaptor subunit [Planctomycetia bacterium]